VIAVVAIVLLLLLFAAGLVILHRRPQRQNEQAQNQAPAYINPVFDDADRADGGNPHPAGAGVVEYEVFSDRQKVAYDVGERQGADPIRTERRRSQVEPAEATYAEATYAEATYTEATYTEATYAEAEVEYEEVRVAPQLDEGNYVAAPGVGDCSSAYAGFPDATDA
jgi:hypothetical protein